jgi:hypothetical protein
MNLAAKRLERLLPIQEISGSNLGPEINNPDWGFPWFVSVPPGKYWHSTAT